MTLVAFATYGKDRAELVTDTSCYDGGARLLARSSKILPIPHLDTVLASQGNTWFGSMVKANASMWAGDAASLDDLIDRLPDLGKRLASESPQPIRDAILFAVGYSPAKDRFAGYVLTSEDDWTPVEVRGLFVHPSPTAYRPSDLEIGRLASVVHPADLEALRHQPRPEKPATREDWITMAKAAREQRACAPVETGLKTLVLGQVWHTTLRRGSLSMECIHEFDDSGAEFQRIIAGTLHPQAQLGPCECGSGLRYMECHMEFHAQDPCLCGSGDPLEDCCRLATTEERATA